MKTYSVTNITYIVEPAPLYYPRSLSITVKDDANLLEEIELKIACLANTGAAGKDLKDFSLNEIK